MDTTAVSEPRTESTSQQAPKRWIGLGVIVLVLAGIAALAVIRAQTEARTTLYDRMAWEAEAAVKDAFRSEFRQEPLFLKLKGLQGISGSGHEMAPHPEEAVFTLKIPRSGTFENGTLPVNIYIGWGETLYVQRIDCWDGDQPDHPRIDVCVTHPDYK